MFKPSAYSEIQKRKKIIIGMHLVELTDRYHYMNIGATPYNKKQKQTSFSQHQKYDCLISRQLTTLPVTPNSKCYSFLESSRLLVSKQANITPRARVVKQKRIKPQIPHLNSQTIEKKDNFLQNFKVRNSQEQNKKKFFGETKKVVFEHTFQSDQDDFIDYVSNKRII